MKRKKKSDLGVLLDYAGSYKCLTFLGLALSAVSMLLSMAPYICIWLAARDLIAVAPEWTKAQSVTRYGWMAFAFPVFRRTDVYPPGGFPDCRKHPEAGGGPCDESSPGIF